jgi:hypothetical protein
MPSYDHMQKSPHFIENGDKIDFKRYLNQTKSIMSRTRGKFENRDLYTFGWGRRICPGIHLVRPILLNIQQNNLDHLLFCFMKANVQLFCIFTTVFSKCTIEPIIGESGNLIYLDFKAGRNAGVSTEILPYKIRFAPRSK